MKQIKSIVGVIVLTTFSTGASAVELTGGDLNFRYSQLDDEILGETLDTFQIDGAIEIGFNRNFATQVDLGHYRFGAIDESGNTLALHGIYHLNDEMSFGVFYGQDEIDILDIDLESEFYGLEAGYETGRFEVEGYFGRADSDGEEADIYGVSGAFGVTDRFDITGAYEMSDFGSSESLDRLELGVRFNATPNAAITASIGSAELDLLGESGSDTFFTIGAEFTFGAERGATFGRRGLLKLIPGL